ncbi:MAG: class C beta-lactamase-related serine hydrolase [Bradyrhizobium sp.]|uniref:serine hydrolase domain-containing protein n=1 Tax=Bradyrhizobium sp. TaxID=376 RepID=UPI00120F0040|nr:serine hydrolase [Bradyrhizobium sp.]THD71046.1 MAG: class C beta-lactamase-related serine hydrolase [Bradyrhizobium sp.]
MVSRKLVASVLVVAALAAAGVVFRPDRAIRVATGVVAHNVCSKTFVSGLDPQTVFTETTDREGLRRLRRGLRYSVDRAGKIVDASLLGWLGSRAAFHDGFGCVLLHGASEPYIPKSDIDALKAAKNPPLLPEIAGASVVEPSDPALKAALDHAFEEPATPPFRRTKAVVVVHDGKVIAERYADGIGVDTPLLGFSMTKSVVNALLGILTEQGRISPSLPAPFPEWRAATDPRHEIEVEHLMRMTTGLALDETNSGFDPSSQMIYLHNDMAGFAAKAAMIAPPGTRWAYSSPTTQLLARIIRDITGGPEQTLAFAWRELFNPLGMQTVTLEFDGAGTLQASTYMLASARDWARFGLLYLNNGEVGGKRILHEDWVDFSAAATLGTDYGAGFWTNRSEHPDAKGRVRLGMPHDAFFASGDLGQRVVILPTQHMVIVRLGDAVDPTGDIRGLGRLVKEAIAATGR